MTLRSKILLITSLTIVGLFVALTSITHTVWYSSFDALEAENVSVNVRRVSAAMTDEIDRLHSTARDWAEWDESLAFVQDGNEEFAKVNLTEDTFERLGVDVIAFVHATNGVTWFRAIDRMTKEPLALPDDVKAALGGADSGLRRADGARGIIAFSDRAAMVVSRPILSSQREGPSPGNFVLMRMLDARTVESIALRTRVSVETFRTDDAALPPDVAGARTTFAETGTVHVETRGDAVIAGYTGVLDVQGRQALMLRVLQPRSIHMEAAAGFRLLIGSLIAAGITFAGLTLFLLERFVLVRLARLSREARDVGAQRDIAHRVTVQGSDELAATGAAINGMLDSLDRARREQDASVAALRVSEERLLQSQKMEAIGRLAGGLAHDFNNLLVVMIGHAEILATKLRGNPTLVHHAEEIQRAGDQSAKLTQRLLAFSRKQALRPVVVDLPELIEQNEDMLRRLVGSDVEVIVTRRGPIDGVLIDPDQITQVLLNLAANARDALRQGGHMTLGTAVVQLDCETDGIPPGRWVELSVGDDGVGMDADTLRHVFEPFFTTKEPGKGTGLGLASAHGIVHQAGGHARVESAVGRGTVFRFYLPAVAPAAASPSYDAAVAPAARGQETILLVDDEPAVRAVASEALKMQGYDVLQADGPEDALRLAQACSAPIRCLVTDVLMPKMRGPELAQRLCAARDDLAVLFMSGYPDDPDLLAAVARGGAFLQKPFRPDALARKVREVLDASAPARS